MFGSLTSRLVLLVTGAIFIVVAVTSAVYHREYNALLSERIVEAIQQDMSIGARRLEQQAAKFHAAIRFLLMAPATKALQTDDFAVHRDRFSELFSTYLETNGNVLQVQYICFDDPQQSLFLSRVDGVVSSGNVSRYAPLQNSDYLTLVGGAKANELVSSGVRLLRDNKGEIVSLERAMMIFAAPVYRQETLLGIIALHISIDSVFKEEKSNIEFIESYLPGSQNYLINAVGDYVLHPEPSKALRYEFNEPGSMVSDWPEVQVLLDDPNARSAFIYAESGQHMILGERFNTGTEEHPKHFFLVLVTPRDSVFSDVYRLQLYIAFLTLTLMLFVMLISGTYIRRKLLPLQRLGKRMRNYDPGQPFQPVELTSKDEISSVTHSFNQSARQLRELFMKERVMREALDKFAIVSIMDINGTMLEVNDKFCQFFGYSQDEMRGQAVQNFRSGLHSDETYDYLWREVLAGKVWRQDMSYRAKDGSILWMETAIVPLVDGDVAVDRVMTIQFDITDRRRLLNELQKQRNKAEHASRVKSDFLASMSHELRTPLNSIIGFSQRLKRKLKADLSPRDMDAVETIERNGQHLLQVINEILDVAKVESGKMTVAPSKFDLCAVVNEVQSTMLTQAKNRNLEIRQSFPDDEILVFLDRKKVTQILLNLLSNAIKYTEHGHVEITLSTQQQGVVIEVADTGIGIKEKDIPKLFNRFSQIESDLNDVMEGTGLGLVLVEEFVSMMGGKVSVSSEYGVGTTFTVILPRQLNA